MNKFTFGKEIVAQRLVECLIESNDIKESRWVMTKIRKINELLNSVHINNKAAAEEIYQLILVKTVKTINSTSVIKSSQVKSHFMGLIKIRIKSFRDKMFEASSKEYIEFGDEIYSRN